MDFRLWRINPVMILMLLIPACLLAQSDRKDWDVGRVFIPTEIQESFIPNDFWPIELRELNEKLAQHEAQALQQRVNPLILDRAVYLATVNRDLIVSENSYWKFSGHHSGSQIRVGNVSFALRDAKGGLADQRQLSSVHRFDVEGTIELETASIDTPFWFGFQAAPKIEESRRVFNFQLPRAKLALMLISADSSMQLSSDQIVIEPVSSPRTYLGETWPAALEPRPQPRQSWWLAHLAGVERFSIEITESSGDRGQVFHHALTSANVVHQVSPDSISTAASFQLATEGKGTAFQLRLGANQRVRSLLVDGKPAAWRAVSVDSASAESSGSSPTQILSSASERIEDQHIQHLIQLNSTSLSKSSKIEIQTITKIPPPRTLDLEAMSSFILPKIELVNSVTIAGSTTVGLDESLEVVEIQSNNLFMPSNPNEASSTSNRWISQWSRQAAASILILKNRRERWTANSIVRLEPQATAISARVNMVLSGSYLRSNELRIPILPGWNVERVRLPLDVSGKIKTGLVSTDQGEQIVLAWTGKPESFEVYLEIAATRLIEGRPTSIAIENPRVVQSPQPGAPTYYVVSDNRFFRLRTTSTLFSMAVAKRDLTSWQQQLIREQDVAVFRDLSGADHKFICDAALDPIRLRMAVVATEKSSQVLEIQTILNFDNGAGSIDHVRVSLPSGQEVSEWNFELLPDSGVGVPLVARSIQTGDVGRVHCQITLPQLSSGEFTILATTKQPIIESMNNTRSIPVLVVEGGTLAESTLILQDRLAPLAASSSLSFQPSTACCSSEIIEKFRQIYQGYDSNGWLSSPISISDSSYISLSSQPKQSSSWLWHQEVQHEVLGSGELRHEIISDIQADRGELITFTLPQSWIPLEALLGTDRVELRRVENNEQSVCQWSINWPLEQRGQLRCIFMQREKKLGWLTKLQVERPALSIPVLAYSESIKIPFGYSKLTWATLLNSGSVDVDSLLHSLLPRNLWSVVSPEESTSIFGTNRSVWTMDSDGNQRQIWLVNDASFVTGSLILLLLGALISWRIIRKTIRGWWVMTLVSISAVVLLRGNLAFVAQIALLALLLGLLARLIETVTTKPRHALRQSPLSASRFVAVLLAAVICKTGYSQSLSSDSNEDEIAKNVYGVIIPYDVGTESPGEYAYIPKELRDLLSGTNQATVNSLPDPRIIAANYVLKLRQDPRDPAPVHEFEAEFKLVVPDTNGQLLLPFDLDVLRPTSLVLNGQAKLLGVRYFEEAENGDGIIFRPDTTGTVTVNIKFLPSIKDSSDRKFKFVTALAAIPNATLRIVPNSLTTGLSTNANGGLLRSLSGDYVAQLGPISELDVQWFEGDRNTTSFVSEYVSETWVRGHNDGISVASQITIDRGRSSQEEYDLIVDSDWEPVGSAWGEAQLVSSSVVTALKRRVIRVRLSESAGATCSFRMLLAQRQPTRATTIDVPFVSVDRMSLKSRVFWWSADGKSSWTPEGIESLRTRVARDDWAELRLASERSGYLVLGSGIKLKQNTSLSAILAHVEATTLRVFSSHSELELDATWEKPVSVESDLVIVLPPQATVKRVESNGRIIPSLVGSQARFSLATSMLGTNATRIKVLVEMPPLQGAITHLPKIEIDKLQPRQSSYSILRGADLRVNFLPTDSGLVFSSSVGRRVNIENLESLVGEANLPTEMLGESKLAAPIEVLPASTAQHRAFTMKVEPVGANFLATVRCSWPAEQSMVDYAMFEIPATLRDQITAAPFSALFKPNRDETRTTLCIPVLAESTGLSRFVEFSFPIVAATTSQSLMLPSITSIHSQPDSPVVILPRELDGKLVQWQTNGVRAEAEWFASEGVEQVKNWEFLRFSDGNARLNWQFVDAEKSQSTVGFTLIDLASVTPHHVAGIVTYGLAPRNQTVQEFQLPENCTVLGVDGGSRQTAWNREGDKIRATLHSHSGPTIVRIIVHWKNDSASQVVISPPKPLAAALPTEVHVRMQAGGAWDLSNKVMESADGSDRAIVDLWAAMLVESMSISKSNATRQAGTARLALDPIPLQLKPDSIISSTSIRSTISSFDANDDGDISVAELWQQASGRPWDDRSSSSAKLKLTQPIHFRVEGQVVELVPQSKIEPKNFDRLLLVAGISFIGVVGLYLGPKLRVPLISMLANQPWMFWAFIAIVFAFVLPVAWPSWIVAMTAVWMAVSQLLDYRRRTRNFGF